MALVTLNATANETPWDGSAFTAAVTTPSNTGHAKTDTDAFESDDTRSIRWGPWPAAPGGTIAIRLKFNWAYEDASFGVNSNNGMALWYSLTGEQPDGPAWTNVLNISNVSGANSGSVDVAIPFNQDLSLFHVREDFSGSSSLNPGGDPAHFEFTISNLRLEVTTADNPPVCIF